VQISVDFAQNGVDVTMLQRTPTFVMSVDKGQALMGQSHWLFKIFIV
jgi:cation diffusion facilitator CzcD-associated flavoprotein CzcO